MPIVKNESLYAKSNYLKIPRTENRLPKIKLNPAATWLILTTFGQLSEIFLLQYPKGKLTMFVQFIQGLCKTDILNLDCIK